jgi:hypothetical protein
MSVGHGSEGPLAEFAALRQEIDDRVKAQHQILTLQLTTSGAIFGFVLSQSGITAMLLIIPLTSYLLCGRLVSQHFGTLLVAQYVREELSAKVSGGLGWEQWILADRRRVRLQGSILPPLLTFPGSGVLALGWTSGFVLSRVAPGSPSGIGYLVVWLVGATVTILSVALILRMPDQGALCPRWPWKRHK